MTIDNGQLTVNARKSNLPDINFVDTNTEALLNAVISAAEVFLDRTLFPADPVRQLLTWVTDLFVQERVLIDTAAKQNLARYANDDYLDSLADMFRDVQRLQPQAARTTLRFYISAQQASAVTIEAGTRVSVDGEITFATTETATIPSGETSVEVPAVCLTEGIIGNGFTAGQISQIVDLFPLFERVENITTSEGGAELESDDALYERYKLSLKTFSTAGPTGAYEYYAKSASALIADAKAYSPSPARVDIRIILQGGVMPGDEMKQIVLKTVSADNVRPLTDLVTVNAPGAVNFNLDLTYFIPRSRENSAVVIRRDVEAAIEQYKNWQTTAMGRDINPDELTTLIRNAGAKRSEIRSPAFTVVERHAVAVLQNSNVIYGGIEDD
ncbi:MAG: baseplate J/gp47 family protein [Oscillospiraceae bacterium]|nr:baseplate J/gp47 family protein [Oscillospiraceae bacterium]